MSLFVSFIPVQHMMLGGIQINSYSWLLISYSMYVIFRDKTMCLFSAQLESETGGNMLKQ